MLNDQELTVTPAYRLRELIGAKQLSPVELTEACLRRVEALNPELNAFLTVCADEAHRDARTAEEAVQRGDSLGPLHGIPTSIKDLLPTKGVRTTRGSLIFKDWVPEEDDLLVARIRDAGAIILGKTNTPEFGSGGGVTENRLGEYCRNPWDPALTSGASSGGAAVSVATGMNPIAHGTDGAGSIRIPASFCGIYGIMGTQGRVPRRNTGPESWSPVHFSRDGPFAWTVRDAALYLQAMSGPHPDAQRVCTIAEPPPDFLAELDGGVKGLRVAWSVDLGSAAVDSEVASIVERGAAVFEELGATVKPAGLNLDVDHLSEVIGALAGPKDFLNYGHLLEESGHLMMPYVREGIELGGRTPAHRYVWALAELERFRAQMDGFFQRFDLLLTPTASVAAFPWDHRPEMAGGRKIAPMWGWYTTLFPFNMSGNPAASIPCGNTTAGLPVGMQIVGRNQDEATVLRASAAFEEARPWAQRRPPLGQA